MTKKANVISAKGVIFKESGNGYFNVELEDPEGHKCLCRASGKLITRKIQLLVGDRVTVELSPFDLSRGRIILREK
jgi:translation initiation factor IF-1